VSTSSVESDTDASAEFVATLREHGLTRIRSAQLQEVSAWEDGVEVAHVGDAPIGGNLSTLAVSILVGCAVVAIAVLVVVVRVVSKRGGRGTRNLEAGKPTPTVAQVVRAPSRPFTHA
jgi:hypothetical protein